jgi:hypothetical protein
MNYTWLNTLILVMFFHALAVASFLALPKTSETLEDSLYKNKNRFAQILLTPEQKKKLKDDTLAKLKSGETGAKAAKAEGKAGRKDLKDVKNPGRMAVKGDPNDKEIAKSTMARLFGPGDKGSSYLFAGRRRGRPRRPRYARRGPGRRRPVDELGRPRRPRHPGPRRRR